MKPLKILIVNDSPSMTAVIRAIVERQPELTVVGAVSNGVEAITSASVLMPDLVLMDIHMPVMGGIEATRRIMASHPSTRILITTATVNRNLKLIFDALQHGALDYVHSPSLPFAPGTKVSDEQLNAAGRSLLGKIRTVLKISDKKIQREVEARRAALTRTKHPQNSINFNEDAALPGILQGRVLAIGCSTGGPTTVAELLNGLQRPFPVPIIICQHIDAEFTAGFSSWLTEQTGFKVSPIRDQMQIQPDEIYVAPGGSRNTEITATGRLVLTTPKPGQVFLPNINQLFFSMAEHLGKRACGVILTGMGSDGAAGIAAIKQMGGSAFAQDLESAVVPSMPRSAQEAMGSALGYPPLQLSSKLNELYFGKR